MSKNSTRVWWVIAAIVALTFSVLGFAQSVGYAILSTAEGGPVRWMWIDHAGPAVTSFLIGVAALAIAVAALVAGRRRTSTAP